MSRNITFAPEEFYHIYNRGTEKRKIFMTAHDYDRFLALLYFCNDTIPVRMDDLQKHAKSQGSTLRELFSSMERASTLVDLCAYCLMPNHFHLLIREKKAGGIGLFMQKIMTAYTMYFNVRYERTGTLLAGKYKATHVEDDRHLKYLVSYIHLNPVKIIDSKWKEDGITNSKKAMKFLEAYRYSSFLDYCEVNRPEKHIVNSNALVEYYDHESPRDFKTTLAEWLEYRPE